MEYLEGRVLSKYLLERYSRNPRGWSFTLAPSRRYGFFDAIVSNPDEAWLLKMDSIFKPTPIMIGARAQVEFGKMNSFNPIPWGYRKLEPRIALELLRGRSETSEGSQNDGMELNLATLLGSKPVVPAGGGSYAQGPFVFTSPAMIKFSEEQKALDEKLASEVQRVLRNRYPSYG